MQTDVEQTKMKTIIMAIAVLLAANTATFAQGKTTKAPKHKTTKTVKYTCEMHPDVVMSKPGKCPKCGMKLTKMTGKKAMKDSTDMKM